MSASSTFDLVIRLKDEATAALGKTSDAADDLAKSENNAADATEKLGAALPQMGNKAEEAGKSLKDVGDKADDTSKKMKNAGDKTGDVGDKFGKVGGAAGKLAGGLDLLVPGLGGAARGIADFADIGEVAAEASTALGLSVGSMVTILGPVAIAVGAAALAWKYFSDQAAAAEEQVKKSAEAVDLAVAASKRLNDLQKNLTREEMIATGKATREDYQNQDSFAQIGSEYQPRIEALQSKTDAANKAIADANAVFANPASTAAAINQASAAMVQAKADVGTYSAEIKGLSQKYTEAIGVAGRTAGAIKSQKSATDEAKSATKANTEALKDEAAAQALLLKAQGIEARGLSPRQQVTQGADAEIATLTQEAIKAKVPLDRIAGAIAQIHAEANDKILALDIGPAFDPLAASANELSHAFDGLDVSTEQAKGGIEAIADAQGMLEGLLGRAPTHTDAVSSAMENLVASYMDGKISLDAYIESLGLLEQAQGAASKLDLQDKRASTISTATSAAGSITSMAALAGPVAGAAAAAVQMASDMGAKAGDVKTSEAAVTTAQNALKSARSPEEIKAAQDQLKAAEAQLAASKEAFNSSNAIGQLTEIIKNLGSLPDAVAMMIGSLLQELIPSLIETVITLLPNLVFSIFEMLLDPSFWKDVGVAIGQAFMDAFKEMMAPEGAALSVDSGKTSSKNSIQLGAGTSRATGEDVSLGQVRRNGRAYASGTDYVDRTGLALVHAGERIVNAAGTGSGTTTAKMGGQGINGTIGGGSGRLAIYLDTAQLLRVLNSDARALNLSIGGG